MVTQSDKEGPQSELGTRVSEAALGPSSPLGLALPCCEEKVGWEVRTAAPLTCSCL